MGRSFEETVWPHLRAAYNYARWMSRNNHDAEDIVQESFTRALQHLDSFRGSDARVWLMSIVHNTAVNFLRGRRDREIVPLDDNVANRQDQSVNAEQELIDSSRREQMRAAIQQLPADFREALVLREFEGLTYKEIGAVLNVPLGTVMSRLSRARALLVQAFWPEKEAGIDV